MVLRPVELADARLFVEPATGVEPVRAGVLIILVDDVSTTSVRVSPSPRRFRVASTCAMTALPTPRPCTEGSTALTDEVEVPLAVVERLRGEPSGDDYDVAGGLGGVDPMVPFEVVVEEFGFVCDLLDPPEVGCGGGEKGNAGGRACGVVDVQRRRSEPIGFRGAGRLHNNQRRARWTAVLLQYRNNVILEYVHVSE